LGGTIAALSGAENIAADRGEKDFSFFLHIHVEKMNQKHGITIPIDAWLFWHAGERQSIIT
jgi:hypothetical protein